MIIFQLNNIGNIPSSVKQNKNFSFKNNALSELRTKFHNVVNPISLFSFGFLFMISNNKYAAYKASVTIGV